MCNRPPVSLIIIMIGTLTSDFIVQARSHSSYEFSKKFVPLPFTNTRRGLMSSHSTSSIFSGSSSLLSRTSIIWKRGGGYSNDYDGYDDYDYDYDPLPQSRKPPRNYPHPRGHPTSSPRNPKKQFSALDRTSDLAKQTLNIATSTTLKTIKGTGKAAYYLTAPKYVTHDEVYGLWRLDQVVLGDTIGDTCAANVQFTRKGDVVTQYNQEKEERTVYHFRSRSWPRSCTIEFEATAFQGPRDVRPVTYYYKGVFRRKMADKSVIKIVGKIYEIKRGRFWKGGGAGLEVGSFVGRRRINSRIQNNFRKEEDVYGAEQSDTYEEYYDPSEEYSDCSYGEEESHEEEL